jgi:hypothetical protein
MAGHGLAAVALDIGRDLAGARLVDVGDGDGGAVPPSCKRGGTRICCPASSRALARTRLPSTRTCPVRSNFCSGP